MKKLAAALSAAMVLATGSTFSAFAIEPIEPAPTDPFWNNFKDGTFIIDANRDGKFDADDAKYIIEYYGTVQTYEDPSEIYSEEEIAFIKENFNYNGDKQVDLLDASYLLVYWSRFYLPENYAMGDVNLDGVVDALDASEILAYYSYKSTSFPDGYIDDISRRNRPTGLGDVNEDGEVNALDASLILADYAASQAK